MARHGFGLHLANGQADHESHTRLIGNGCFTVLDDQANLLPKIREIAPLALTLVRHYLPDWDDVSPLVWARSCAERYLQHKPFTKHLTWANEQNLRHESAGGTQDHGADPGRRADREDYEYINVWNREFIKAFLAIPGCDDAVLHYPASAPGHSDDQDDYGFVGLDICRPSIDLCPILDVHCYPELWAPIDDLWRGAARVELVKRLFPGKLLFISECGNFQVTNQNSPQHYVNMGYFWQADPAILGWTYFIADDPTHSHGQNNMSFNHNIFEAIERAAKTPKLDNWNLPPPPPPIVHQPTVGEGFRKAAPFIGLFTEDEIYHWDEVSVALAERGYATWYKQTNATTVFLRDGSVYTDGGNKPINGGKLVKIR